MKILFYLLLCIILYFSLSLIYYSIGRLTIKRFPRFGSLMWSLSGLRIYQLKKYCSCDCSSCKNYNCKNLKIKDGSK